MDVGVHIDPFKPQVLQLLSGFGVSLGVQESPLEGVQEIVPGLRGLICLFVYFRLFLYERVYFFSLDEGHGEGHPPFVCVERGNPLVEAQVGGQSSDE